MQKLMIAGTISKDAELRRTQAGDAVCGFSVVVSNGKDKDGNWRDGTFYDCSMWGNFGEKMQPYLTKGQKVTIIGRPTARAHDGKAYLGCQVDDIDLQGNRSEQAPRASGSTSGGYGGGGDMDDEQIPFSMEWR